MGLVNALQMIEHLQTNVVIFCRRFPVEYPNKNCAWVDNRNDVCGRMVPQRIRGTTRNTA